MAEDPTPSHSQGFGPAEDADATRQSQHSMANDTPTDVNFNSILARAQAEQVNFGGKNYEANADRRNKIADHFMGKQMGT